jgi:hypothetical protein
VSNSGFGRQIWEIELTFVSHLEDFSVGDFCSYAIQGWREIGDGAVDSEVISCGAAV